MSAVHPEARVPVVLVASIDPVLRESAVAGMLADLPGAVALRHDLHPDEGLLHRTVYDMTTVLDEAWLPLDHACLSCAMREDILPTVQRVTTSVRPQALVLALPVTAEPLALVPALSACPRVRVAGLVTVLDADRFECDLFGDDLLAERDLALGVGDRRSVGETVAHQIEVSDVLLTPQPPPPRVSAVIDHLVDSSVTRGLMHDSDGSALVARRRVLAAERGDLLTVRPTGAPPRDGVWTLDLQSWRPFHPERLLEHIEALGTGMVRGRGHFWLPTRPDDVCAWDGAGGQLSIGNHGQWRGRPGTHLVITGVGSDPGTLLRAFEAALLHDSELARGLPEWRGRPDGLDPWLGEQRGAA